MGLDMYLKKRTYVGNQYRKEEERVKVVLPKSQENVSFPIQDEIKTERISEITEDVAYWRKANAIHKWFVDNVQGGEDDCDDYYVSKEQLRELIDACKNTIEVVEKAPKITKTEKDWNGEEYEYEIFDVNEDELDLTTQSGFFFGGTQYNTYFLDSLRNTISQLEPLLNEKGDFYYTSSW